MESGGGAGDGVVRREAANTLSRFGMLWKNPRGYGMEVLEVFLPPAADQAGELQAAGEALGKILQPRE